MGTDLDTAMRGVSFDWKPTGKESPVVDSFLKGFSFDLRYDAVAINCRASWGNNLFAGPGIDRFTTVHPPEYPDIPSVCFGDSIETWGRDGHSEGRLICGFDFVDVSAALAVAGEGEK